jgi:AcrR family transcriptional regulator
MQAAERKRQILDIAMRLFAEKGYHATSMRELNKEIGMAEALTYHYFPGGKLEILRSVLQNAQEERIASIVGFFRGIFSGEGRLQEVLPELIEGISKRVRQDQAYFLILFRERALLDQEQKAALEELTKQPFRAMEAYLAKLSAQGAVRSMDFGMAASQFLSHIVVLIVQGFMNGNVLQQTEMERIVEYYAHLWEG